MNRTRLVFGLLLLTGASVSAQSLPSITKPKEAARRAVDATNAHTAAMTADQGATPAAKTPVPTPSPAAAKPAPDSTHAKQAEHTESSAGSSAVKAIESHGFQREVFSYAPEGRRDPFISLMSTGELRPLFTDLVIDGIVFDMNGKNSVAIMHDVGTKEQYRARVGSTLGRMRVSRIDPKSVSFTIEEFGFSRQETLSLGDSKQERKQ